jgi:hypothetical protein
VTAGRGAPRRAPRSHQPVATVLNMAENVLRSIFAASGGPDQSRKALESLRTETTATFESIVEASRRALPAFEQTTQAIDRLARTSGSAFDQMRGHTERWSSSATSTFARVVELIQRHIAVEQLSAVESGGAEAHKTLLHKAAVQERAVVEAVKEAAAGFAALGDFDFWSAAQHFASAALWGSLAALQIASAVGAFGGGSRGSGRDARATGTGYVSPGPAPQLASGSAGPAGAGPGGNVNVVIMGEAGGAEWLAGVLNRHVQQRGGKLVSSRAVRPVPAGA